MFYIRITGLCNTQMLNLHICCYNHSLIAGVHKRGWAVKKMMRDAGGVHTVQAVTSLDAASSKVQKKKKMAELRLTCLSLTCISGGIPHFEPKKLKFDVWFEIHKDIAKFVAILGCGVHKGHCITTGSCHILDCALMSGERIHLCHTIKGEMLDGNLQREIGFAGDKNETRHWIWLVRLWQRCSCESWQMAEGSNTRHFQAMPADVNQSN